VYVPLSNGGVFGHQNAALFPCQSILDGSTSYYAFDPTQGFDDPNTICKYSWRVEQAGVPGVQFTIRRLLVTYRDLGRVSLRFTLTGGNDIGGVVSNSVAVAWGNKTATNQLFTTLVSLTNTALDQQLSVVKMGGEGPLSIAQVIMVTDQPETTV
jgi:hypothetical protein